ncbi:hypothetical protein AVEN_103932-1 [Araneus ventricosus]|uniref:Uncharacterized protein n=1 Tax=Araneus ventricosus TaxID=182803 RepID=A0A4Y2V6T8_ARAVE|nr:hypothetical protein AVEN_103932-1 [Araneus ventricosus]
MSSQTFPASPQTALKDIPCLFLKLSSHPYTQKMKILTKKDLLNDKVHFRDGIKLIRVDTFGSYLFKENFDGYTLFREVNIHIELKKKSSLTDDFAILRLFRKTGTLSKEKVENLKEQLYFIPDQHKWFYQQALHEII